MDLITKHVQNKKELIYVYLHYTITIPIPTHHKTYNKNCNEHEIMTI